MKNILIDIALLNLLQLLLLLREIGALNLVRLFLILRHYHLGELCDHLILIVFLMASSSLDLELVILEFLTRNRLLLLLLLIDQLLLTIQIVTLGVKLIASARYVLACLLSLLVIHVLVALSICGSTI